MYVYIYIYIYIYTCILSITIESPHDGGSRYGQFSKGALEHITNNPQLIQTIL